MSRGGRAAEARRGRSGPAADPGRDPTSAGGPRETRWREAPPPRKRAKDASPIYALSAGAVPTSGGADAGTRGAFGGMFGTGPPSGTGFRREDHAFAPYDFAQRARPCPSMTQLAPRTEKPTKLGRRPALWFP